MKVVEYVAQGRISSRNNYTRINSFLTNVPLMDKPDSWFLLAKCLKNTSGRVAFEVKM